MRTRIPPWRAWAIVWEAVFSSPGNFLPAGQLELVPVEGQPLAANVRRLLEALEFLGSPLPAATAAELREAARGPAPADGRIRELRLSLEISRSSWVALRHFPELHTNPVNALCPGTVANPAMDEVLRFEN
ncbi:MAG: hypothetical protein HY717_12785 [Planctomycetes bacterium]|nr:hypothetical protein [Planctomycetota bacterium]